MRDRDVRNEIAQILADTAAFQEVRLGRLPENYGFAAGQLSAVVIEPKDGSDDDRWDGLDGIVTTSNVTLTFMFRDEDPQRCDDGVEQLFNTAKNALNGQSLAGLTMPPKTRFTSWRFSPPRAPERRLVANFMYQYLDDRWNEFDQSD